MIGFQRFYLIFMVLPFLWACADDRYSFEGNATRNAADHGVFEDILVRRNNLLFANIGSFEGSCKTRSGSDESDLVSLESLLDRSGTETLVFKNYHIVQIPFRAMDHEQQASLSDTNHGSMEKDGVSVVRKFLVEISDTLAGTRRHIVATLVPTPENCMAYGPDSYSYIDKGTFEGVILFSDLDGSLRSVNSYGHRPIRNACVIAPEDTLNYWRIRYINVYGRGSATRAQEVDGGSIEESICVGEKPKKKDNSEGTDGDEDYWGDGLGGGGGNGSGGGGSNGGGADGVGTDSDYELDPSLIMDKYEPKKKKEEDDVVWYTVTLHAVGKGQTRGSGRYSSALLNFILAEAAPDDDAYFDRWTGDFHGRGELLEFRVDRDVTSTAYFAPKIGDPVDPYDPVNRPCFSKATKVGNPLNNMSIASPGWSGLRGGTFGHVRNGGERFHNGLDLFAEEGTPVYAMIDGVISNSNYTINQPDKKAEDYPNGYRGDKNSAGNRVYVEGRYDGQDVIIGYCHLQAGTPVAINPRTGKMFKPGDAIYRGELLGYTGRTGNAYNVTNKHLHLLYKVKNSNGVYVFANPEKIINGSVDWKDGDPSTKKIIGGKIVDVECDTEEKVNIL